MLTQTKYEKWCLHKSIKFKTLMQLSFFIFLLNLGEKRRLGPVMIKTLIAQTILGKIF